MSTKESLGRRYDKKNTSNNYINRATCTNQYKLVQIRHT